MTATNLALWLAANVDAAAQDQAGGELYADIKHMIETIEDMINRPKHHRYCGPCPTLVDEQPCGVGLFAKWDKRNKCYEIEVECWRCRTTHNADRLIQKALNESAGLLYSAREVQELMAQIGEPIPASTWRRWRADGRLVVRGWFGAEPMYWISDVRELVAAKPQRLPTGAAAHRVA